MNKIVEILETYSSKVLLDEDGNQLTIEKSEAITVGDLQRFELYHGIILPPDLRKLLMFSNGINVFGVRVQALNEMKFYDSQMLLTFHDWGNGDFDCISVNSRSYYGSVYFINHSIAKNISMAITISEWISLCINEIQKKGTVLHPMDYLFRHEDGMYKEVFLKLKMK